MGIIVRLVNWQRCSAEKMLQSNSGLSCEQGCHWAEQDLTARPPWRAPVSYWGRGIRLGVFIWASWHRRDRTQRGGTLLDTFLGLEKQKWGCIEHQDVSCRSF